ncbi:hypothetical protein HMI54_008397 [Coelomomyces lativittatus]|nr:hypothetical protein HMI54_008397 [Coelomomyces lativittatus]
MVAGSVLVVWFANHDNTSRSLCSLLSFYRRPSMITYLSIMILLIFLSWLFINVMETNVQMNHPSLSSLDSNSPALRRLHHQWRVEVFKINRPISKHSRLYKYVLPFLYAGMGGALGGLTVLFAKSSAELITITLSGDNQFVFLPTYLILAAIVVTGIGQVYYINQGLQRYDALLQVPAFYVIYTLCGILSGGVYFDDFKDFKPSQLLFFCIGVGLTFSGVMLLGFRLKKTVALEEALESASGPEEKQLAEHGHRLKVNTSSKQGLQDIDPTLDGWEVLPSSLFPPESPDAPLQPLPPVLNLPKNQKTTLKTI